MADLIKSVVLTFNASGSSDVAGYALYVEDAPNPPTRNSKRIDLGNPSPDSNGVIEVELSAISEVTTLDGTYNLGVVSVDDAGNESSMLTEGIQNVALDFTAPNPPTNAFVSYV
jgi:hypothetical protein